MNKKMIARLAAALLISTSLTTGIASAHGVWFASRLDQTQLVLGEGFKDNAYKPEMVTSVQGYTKDYAKINIPIINKGDHITINPSPDVSVAVVTFDYGYWSNGTDGKFHNAPMDQVPGSTIGTHAIKYSVNYLKSVDKVEPIPGLPYQIVPLKDPTKLNVGDQLPIQVLHDGQPMPDVEIIPDVANHHTVVIKADKDGKAIVPVANGSVNVIGVELTLPYKEKSAKATRDKVFTSLSFTIYPQEED